MSKASESPLETAAAGLESELQRFERLTEALRKAPLNSQKALERAGGTLKEIADADERLAARIREMVDAFTGARDRQMAQARLVQTRAEEIQVRTQAFRDLMQRFATLGQDAAELNTRMQAMTPKGDKATAEQARELLGGVRELAVRMEAVAQVAQGLATDAEQQEFTDLARSADSLRQQLLGAKNKIGLLEKTLAVDGPEAGA